MQVTPDGSLPAGRAKRVSFKDKSPAERALLVKARNRKAQQVSMSMSMIVAENLAVHAGLLRLPPAMYFDFHVSALRMPLFKNLDVATAGDCIAVLGFADKWVSLCAGIQGQKKGEPASMPTQPPHKAAEAAITVPAILSTLNPKKLNPKANSICG